MNFDNFLIPLSIEINNFFNIQFIAVIAILISADLYIKNDFNKLKVFLGSGIATAVLTFLIKEITKVERPADALVTLSDYAFPSGHASISFWFLIFITYFLYDLQRPRWFKIVFFIIFLITSVLITLSRLIINVHDFWQILAGAILGIVVTILTIWFFEKREKVNK